MFNKKSIELYNALHKLVRQMHRFSHKVEHRTGYRREQARLLHVISEDEGITQRELAEIMDVRPSSMTAMIAKLEQFGFIMRKQDERDQRVMHIYLTDEGRNIEKETLEPTQALIGQLFENLTDEEISEMIRIIQKLSQNLENQDMGTHMSTRHHGHHRHVSDLLEYLGKQNDDDD